MNTPGYDELYQRAYARKGGEAEVEALQPSFARELRRRAIALQPTRRINAPVTVLHRGEADCCWLDQQTPTTYIKLTDGSHKALIEDSAVRAGWSVYFEQWAAAHGLC